MNLADLRAWLANHGITVAETRQLASGQTFYIFTSSLPAFPFGHNKQAWYPLAVDQAQTFIPREEIEALLRHFWFAQLEIPSN